MKLVLLLTTLYVAQAMFSKKDMVMELDIDNFDTEIAKHKVSMIEFYAPWCGHCQQLKPAYIAAAKELGGGIPLFAVDANEEKNAPIAQKFQVRGFPTLFIIVDGKPEPYQGARDTAGIVKALRSKVPNKVVLLKGKKMMKEFKKLKTAKAVLINKKKSSPDYWKALTIQFEDYMTLYESRKDKDFASKNKVDLERNRVLVWPANAKKNAKPLVYEGLMKAKAIKRFLKKHVEDFPDDGEDFLPAITDQSCMQQHCLRKGLCVLVMLGGDKDDAERVHTVAKEFEENSDRASLFGFGAISMPDNYEWVEKHFPGLSGDYSQMIVFSPKKMRYARYVGSFSHSTVKSFVHGILTGRTSTSKCAVKELQPLSEETENCKPPPKPEPKPQQQRQQQQQQQQGDMPAPGQGSDFLLHPTGATFEAEVEKSTQPSIVEFYAPWCGHCKQLAPHFAAAAEKLQGMVQFVGIDCTVEAQLCQKFGIQGYPSMKIFADGKMTDYRRGRTAKDMARQANALLKNIDVETFTDDNIEDFKSMDGVKALFFSNKKKIPTVVRALVSRYPDATIGFVPGGSDAAAEAFGVTSFPTIIDGSTGKVYEGDKKFMDFAAWLESLGAAKSGGSSSGGQEAAATAGIPEITSAAQWKKNVAKKAGNTILCFFDNDAITEARDGNSEELAILEDIAAANPDSPFRFAFVSKNQQALVEGFNVEEDTEVDLVIVNPKRKRFATFEGDFTQEDVSDWIMSVKKGKVKTTKLKKFPSFEDVADKEEL